MFLTLDARSLTLLIFAVWSTTTRTRVRDATAVTFSVKCFNPLKLFCRETSSKTSLLIHSQAFNIYLSPMVNNLIDYIATIKEYLTNKIFSDFRYNIPSAILSEVFSSIG